MSRYPEVGSTLGRYRLAEELGRGGMAVVFRAEDPTLQRQVAIKVLHEHLWDRPEYASRFVREARAVARLRHPNIVEVYDYSGSHDSACADRAAAADGSAVRGYIVAELLRGPTLRQFIERRGALLPEVATMIALRLAEALACAHGEGIVHRDLKPDNVIIAQGGRVVLTDFGIARILEGESVTQTGALLGSPGYMSPEQARGDRVDARSDLFSLGTLLYQLSTGALPFVGKDAISTVLRILEGRSDPASVVNPRISKALERTIARLMQPQPADRFQRAEEVADALRQQLDEVGLADVDSELARYFDDPGGYNGVLIERVVHSSLRLAREAIVRRDLARALSQCDRVLALDPDNTEALGLVRQLSTARSRLRWTAAALSGLLVVAAGLLWATARDPSSVPRPLPTLIHRVEDGAQRRPDAAGGARASVQDAIDAGERDAALAIAQTAPPPSARTRRRRLPRPASRSHDAMPPREAAPRPPDAAPAAPRDSRASGNGKVLVTIGPWCDVTLDGRPLARSPMTRAVEVSPGSHTIVCQQGRDGLAARRTIQVTAGQTTLVEGLLRAGAPVRIRLGRGDAVTIDGQRHGDGQQLRLAPSRYRVDVHAGARILVGGWVTIPPTGCVLVDLPQLRCR